MKHPLTLWPRLLLLALLVWMGCSGDGNNNSGTQPEPSPPKVPEPLQVSVPAKAPLAVKSWSNQLTNFLLTSNGYLTLLQTGHPVQQGEFWVWNLQVQQLSVVVKAKILDNNQVSWQVIFNGSSDSTTYNNWTAVQGTTSVDGSEGTLQFFETNTTTLAATLSWTRHPDGRLEITYTIASTGMVFTYVEMSSGTTELKATDSLGRVRFQAQWTATGGWWKEFDENGNVIDQGNW
ncbi:MAG: hypothetical protein D6715_05470 [Calditrichaeota bacterium]|nr:MAG: hypothetical protein D6715_05470 [Calditrichota bacterium]